MKIIYKDKEITIESNFTLESLTEECTKLSWHSDENLYDKRYTFITKNNEESHLFSIVRNEIERQMQGVLRTGLSDKTTIPVGKVRFKSVYLPSIGQVDINPAEKQ